MLVYYLQTIESEEDKSKFERIYYRYRKRNFFSWAFSNEENPPPFYYGVHKENVRRVMIRGNAGEYIPDSDGVGGGYLR